MSRALLLFFALICALIGIKIYQQIKPIGVPQFEIDNYWGPGSKDGYRENTEIKPQEIFYTATQLNKIKSRLNETIKFLRPLEDTFDEYGMNTIELQKVLQYWKEDYFSKWEERQTFLNKYPHFLTEIQGLNLHFLHIKPQGDLENKTVLPLLLLHGWPGSVREFYELIPLLTTPNEDSAIVFEVVVPSLPGFGWSEGAKKPGFGVLEMSIVLRNLMLRLGYEQFYVQGGDWGAVLGSTIATLFPENTLGYHSNMCALYTPLSIAKSVIASYCPSLFIDPEYESFVFPVWDQIAFLIKETGFAHLQATKPDTIGAVITDNPVGLAAYILEKFSHFFDVLTRESVLDNLTIYALTNSFASSVRIYAEAYSSKELSYELLRVPTHVPTGCARFKNDVGHHLDWQLRDKYTNLIHSSFYLVGGHFAAMEVPEILYEDLLTFVEKAQQIEK